MKKILIIAGMAATMVSCTSEEPTRVSDSYAIGFSTYVGKATRAGDVSTESLASFTVYGGTDKTEFNGTAVTKANGAWTYSPLQYWTEGAKYNFAAVAPAVEGASYSASKLTIANYSPADDDLIVAATNEITGAAAGSNNLVTLNFKHALSKVLLTFANGDLSKLSNVKLSSVSNKANLEVAYSEGTAATWGASAGTGDYTYTIDATSGQGVKYLLPQTIGDAVKVSYTYNEVAKEVVVKTADVAAWEMGKAYNYQISLSADAIGFDVVEAADWTSVDLATAEGTTADSGTNTGDNTSDVVPTDVTLIADNASWIRSNSSSTNYNNQADMEIKSYDDYNFYGLVGFTLPDNLNVAGYKLTATLRLVTTQCKGDRNIDLYDFGTNAFSESDATYDNYGSTCESIIASNEPVATFEAKGCSNKAMKDSGLTENYLVASAWSNNIDLSELVSTKSSGSALTLIIARQVKNNNSFKFGTQRSTDITGSDTEGNSVTFAAADLVPQLVITYTKE